MILPICLHLSQRGNIGLPIWAGQGLSTSPQKPQDRVGWNITHTFTGTRCIDFSWVSDLFACTSTVLATFELQDTLFRRICLLLTRILSLEMVSDFLYIYVLWSGGASFPGGLQIYRVNTNRQCLDRQRAGLQAQRRDIEALEWGNVFLQAWAADRFVSPGMSLFYCF